MQQPGSGPTLRRHAVLVGTAGQAAVVRVQSCHVTGTVAARRRTLALLLLSSRRVWKGHREEIEEVIPGLLMDADTALLTRLAAKTVDLRKPHKLNRVLQRSWIAS